MELKNADDEMHGHKKVRAKDDTNREHGSSAKAKRNLKKKMKEPKIIALSHERFDEELKKVMIEDNARSPIRSPNAWVVRKKSRGSSRGRSSERFKGKTKKGKMEDYVRSPIRSPKGRVIKVKSHERLNEECKKVMMEDNARSPTCRPNAWVVKVKPHDASTERCKEEIKKVRRIDDNARSPIRNPKAYVIRKGIVKNQKELESIERFDEELRNRMMKYKVSLPIPSPNALDIKSLENDTANVPITTSQSTKKEEKPSYLEGLENRAIDITSGFPLKSAKNLSLRNSSNKNMPKKYAPKTKAAASGDSVTNGITMAHQKCSNELITQKPEDGWNTRTTVLRANLVKSVPLIAKKKRIIFHPTGLKNPESVQLQESPRNRTRPIPKKGNLPSSASNTRRITMVPKTFNTELINRYTENLRDNSLLSSTHTPRPENHECSEETVRNKNLPRETTASCGASVTKSITTPYKKYDDESKEKQTDIIFTMSKADVEENLFQSFLRVVQNIKYFENPAVLSTSRNFIKFTEEVRNVKTSDKYSIENITNTFFPKFSCDSSVTKVNHYKNSGKLTNRKKEDTFNIKNSDLKTKVTSTSKATRRTKNYFSPDFFSIENMTKRYLLGPKGAFFGTRWHAVATPNQKRLKARRKEKAIELRPRLPKRELPKAKKEEKPPSLNTFSNPATFNKIRKKYVLDPMKLRKRNQLLIDTITKRNMTKTPATNKITRPHERSEMEDICNNSIADLKDSVPRSTYIYDSKYVINPEWVTSSVVSPRKESSKNEKKNNSHRTQTPQRISATNKVAMSHKRYNNELGTSKQKDTNLYDSKYFINHEWTTSAISLKSVQSQTTFIGNAKNKCNHWTQPASCPATSNNVREVSSDLSPTTVTYSGITLKSIKKQTRLKKNTKIRFNV